MKVGDIVEFRCPDIWMEEKFKIRGVGLVIDERLRDVAFRVQWASGEVSWEHKTYLELL
jgi:hypothetical protein